VEAHLLEHLSARLQETLRHVEISPEPNPGRAILEVETDGISRIYVQIVKEKVRCL